MQRFVNDPNTVVEDMLQGFTEAYTYIERSEENERVVYYRNQSLNHVGLVSGGGSGHEPAFLGYVGKHMLDAVAVGEVFSSPTAAAFHEAFRKADRGAGVACLFGNYAGDNMNVKMAVELAEEDDICVRYVVATDDISSAPKEEKEKRHGIAGGPLMWKTAGACAARGASLKEVIRVAQKLWMQRAVSVSGFPPVRFRQSDILIFPLKKKHMNLVSAIMGSLGWISASCRVLRLSRVK